MTRTERDEGARAEDLVRRQMGEKGYVIRLRTEKVDNHLVGTITVTSAKDGMEVARLVGAGRVEDLDLAVGVHMSEGTLKELVAQLLMNLDVVRGMLPQITITR